MSLDRAHANLGWPTRKNILKPGGAGARVIAEVAQQKLRRALLGFAEAADASIGLLLPDSSPSSAASPVALVCEFKRVPSEAALIAVHKFAWNLCQAPLLLTVDPKCVRAWSCCEAPVHSAGGLSAASQDQRDGEIIDAAVEWESCGISTQAASALEWVNLVWGHFFSSHEDRFPAEGRADTLLVENLQAVRAALHNAGLPYNIAHDLLGRVIFIQFLFQRTDSNGRSALNANVLERLFLERKIGRSYTALSEILANHGDTYRFFRWLNDRFNGDLFPGAGKSPKNREAEWQSEIRQVKAEHLDLLSKFVSGDLEIESGQQSLFPLYSFDTIPLELISSVYEEFIGENGRAAGGHYTPGHIVDFMLDEVLPWSGKDWDIKVLDPACGSGIFLVKAFRRLVHRWKTRNPQSDISAQLLKQILEKNLWGIDINSEAIRVASFSLYLAMCDEIDPRYYWTQVRFPQLRGRNLINDDFFSQSELDTSGIKFDVIIGNAPWGKGTVTPAARDWSGNNEWPISYGGLAPLFIPRSLQLSQPKAKISFLQPLSLLGNSVGTARRFRTKLFSTVQVEQVVNLSALRFDLFSNAVDPPCIVTASAKVREHQSMQYLCPKPTCTAIDAFSLSVDEQDVHNIDRAEAEDGRIWSILMWGTRRDAALISRLQLSDSLARLGHAGIKHREGNIRGDRKRRDDNLLGRPILEASSKHPLFLRLDASDLPVNQDPFVHSKDSTDLDAFERPQLIIKQSWTKKNGRFAAAVVEGIGKGVLCTQSYISVHGSEQLTSTLETAAAVYNSAFAVYYLLLTSARFSSYRPEPLVADMLSLPLPNDPVRVDLSGLTYETLDRAVRDAFGFTDAEWTSIEDLCKYVLSNFKEGHKSVGRTPTRRTDSSSRDHEDVVAYCESFMRVLQSGFGGDKPITGTVFQEAPAQNRLPVRLAAIHLSDTTEQPGHIRRESIQSGDLVKRLRDVSNNIVSPGNSFVVRNRALRVYQNVHLSKDATSPTIFIMKPDQRAYWTRSSAMRDADEVAYDIIAWSTSAQRAEDMIGA